MNLLNLLLTSDSTDSEAEKQSQSIGERLLKQASTHIAEYLNSQSEQYNNKSTAETGVLSHRSADPAHHLSADPAHHQSADPAPNMEGLVEGESDQLPEEYTAGKSPNQAHLARLRNEFVSLG